jgi:ATP/maltotriose-dependent transcriptional regulator MalT
LSLVCAPAGFGKTTLVSTWLGTLRYPHAWLALDEDDNDPARFCAYLMAALHTIDADIGQDATEPSLAAEPQMFLTSLLNDIAATPCPFVLVLDDYHLIHTPSVHQQLVFLVEHQPPQMHLVIATREKSPLPLSRLRARGQMAEIRRADLEFTVPETTDLWYRYHHLFADLLRHRLEIEPAYAPPLLHQRASQWYADNGLPVDAIRHALAASDWKSAAALILDTADSLLKRGEVVTLIQRTTCGGPGSGT